MMVTAYTATVQLLKLKVSITKSVSFQRQQMNAGSCFYSILAEQTLPPKFCHNQIFKKLFVALAHM